ncbi:hypothetical protein [Geoalkalibacter halelectricus]|uniref:Uncharacterized protein n=1 Tax=Geoalkalibacter halelectricus TaxID=2847045 RepID=A0ABY5ZPL1_9BACT|nr:hypothetical protein [Geoalkalibacter halelectricus]MDO3378263.1 hypothetical protein [Geoalkalibacter halelectricus]UWZ79146.1 hypothetical protein L9S41_15890 [Geoalkalibacter halelectricus]
MKKNIQICLTLLCFLFLPFVAVAEPTQVTVRVLSNDAKFIGTGMGGIHVILRDATTGEILDQGLIEGSTGDTPIIMQEPRVRGEALARGGGAKWVGSIDISEPTRVLAQAVGPIAAGGSQQETSLSFWVLPGHHIEGDGILLTFYGFTVHPISPGPHQNFKPGDEVRVEAHVVTMCGCPVAPGGLWDADNYQIKAQVRSAEGPVTEFPLEFTGTVNRFAGSFTVQDLGSYKIIITAADPAQNNYGVGQTSIVVR